MPKIVFNDCPRSYSPFPLSKFDHEIDLISARLSYSLDRRFNRVFIEVEHDKRSTVIAEIKLYHSAKMHNFEQTFESAIALANEIVNRFNSFIPKGQQCFEL